MSEHWPENMIGERVNAWCKVCRNNTPHRIDRVAVGAKAGKLGPCLFDHTEALTEKQKKLNAEIRHRRENPELPFA